MRAPSLLRALGRIRRGALLTLVFGLPLVFLWDVTYLVYDAPKLALLVAATSVAAAARMGELLLGSPATGLRRAAAPAAFVVVPTAVAWLATEYKSWGLLGSYARYEGLVPILLGAAAGVLLAEEFAPDYRVVARAFVASAAGVGAYAVIESLGLAPFGEPVVDYAASTIGHPNFVGGFLAIALPVALGLTASAAGRGRYAGMAAVIAIVLGIVLAFSQGGWVAAAAGVAVYAGGALQRRHRLAHPAGWVAAGLLACALVGLVVVSLIDPFNPAVPSTTRARGLWWRAAVSMASEAPVWGRGPNAYAIEGPHHRTGQDALAHDILYSDEPHSVPLGLLANHGVLGLAGFAALAAWIVRRAIATPGPPVLNGFGAGAAAYLVQSLVSINALVLVVASWVCIAALTRGAPRRGERSPGADGRNAAWRTVAAIALVAGVTVTAVWWSGRFLYADARVWTADEAFRAGRTGEALETMESVLRTRDDNHYRYLYGAMLGTAALREGADGADEIERMDAAFSYVRDFPEMRALLELGEGHHQWSLYDPALETRALEVLERAVSLDEYSPTLRVLLAESLTRLDRAPEAVDRLEEMVPLMREFPEYPGSQPMVWATLAIARFYEGDDSGARAALTEAETIAEAISRPDQCHVLVAGELVRRGGEPATRDEYLEESRGLLLCNPATLALLPGFDPQVED